MTINDKVLSEYIEKEVENYLKNSKLQSVVIGISGGLDSGLNAVILKRVCQRLGISVIGRFIQIESNTPDEKKRADAIGEHFCDDYCAIDMTETYRVMKERCECAEKTSETETNFQKKIRLGNIKVRMRMIYLYNLAQKFRGLVIDNDNYTEQMLGFYTLHGDVGDLTPLADLMKTEVKKLAEYYYNEILTDSKEKEALKAVIDCVPTDGLGITSSDVEQFGVKSYDEVDDILATYIYFGNNEDMWKSAYEKLCAAYTQESVDKVISRHKNSAFKRKNPFRVSCVAAK